MIFAVIPAIRTSVFSVVENLLNQKLPPEKIIIVDNSLSLSPKEDFGGKVEILVPDENIGSAGGYALGISKCLEYQNCEFVFTSDDDVLYEKNAIFELYRKLNELRDAGAVRCAWSGYTGETREVESSVWTGVLIKKHVIQEIGLPLKELFLYGDDVEYFLRMRKKGFKMYIVKEARYLSRKRDQRTEKGFYSNPSRLYYAFRNEIYIGLTYNRTYIIRTLGYFVKNAFFMDRKSLFASLEGIKDGFIKKLGKNPKYTTF